MTTKCIHCPLRQLSLFEDMSPPELEAMADFKVGEMQVEAGTPLMMQGSNSPQLYTALQGMGLRSKVLPNGKRQVVSFVLPGDFIGLQAALTDVMGHSVEATTDMTLCVFNRTDIWNFFRDNPQRGFALTWLAAVEERFLGDALTTVGQRTAIQSIAWSFAKLYLKGEGLGLARNRQMPLPFVQQDLADALGLSIVHVNRVLKQLRDRQIATWQDGLMTIGDWSMLTQIAMIEDDTVAKRPLM